MTHVFVSGVQTFAQFEADMDEPLRDLSLVDATRPMVTGLGHNFEKVRADAERELREELEFEADDGEVFSLDDGEWVNGEFVQQAFNQDGDPLGVLVITKRELL